MGNHLNPKNILWVKGGQAPYPKFSFQIFAKNIELAPTLMVIVAFWFEMYRNALGNKKKVKIKAFVSFRP